MPTTSLVSVIVPAYNAARFLPQAVESVVRQTHHNLELIIVDDGSTDATPQLADGFVDRDRRVRVIHKANGGLSSARNAGLAAARGAYLCFLDSDDALLPDKIERPLAFLDFFLLCDLVYSDHYIADDALNPISVDCRSPPDVPMQELLSYCNWFAPISPLMRARLVKTVGYFDEELSSAEDWDYWIRASRCGVLAYLPGPVAVYRRHAGQMHHDWSRMRSNQEKVIRKNFAPGSKEWRLAHAAMAWTQAKRSRAKSSYFKMAVSLCAMAWNARSKRDLRAILQFAY